MPKKSIMKARKERNQSKPDKYFVIWFIMATLWSIACFLYWTEHKCKQVLLKVNNSFLRILFHWFAKIDNGELTKGSKG